MVSTSANGRRKTKSSLMEQIFLPACRPAICKGNKHHRALRTTATCSNSESSDFKIELLPTYGHFQDYFHMEYTISSVGSSSHLSLPLKSFLHLQKTKRFHQYPWKYVTLQMNLSLQCIHLSTSLLQILKGLLKKETIKNKGWGDTPENCGPITAWL